MDYIQAVIYGIVQGIAEFLPISSTAHLRLIPWLLGWAQPDTAFDVALHLGTAAAVILYFFRDWISLLRGGLTRPASPEGKRFWLIVLATIPGGLAGVFLDPYMDIFNHPALTGLMLIFMGVVLYAADKCSSQTTALEQMTPLQSLGVGLSQILAIIPGVSRSGVTISTGRMLGLTRDAAARFTFLMSAPIIFLDGVYHARAILHEPVHSGVFLTAVLTSFVTGLISIRFLLRFLQRRGFGIFALYRLLFGAAVIMIALC